MELAGVLKKKNVEIPGVFEEKLMHMWIFTGLEPGSWFYFTPIRDSNYQEINFLIGRLPVGNLRKIIQIIGFS